MRFYVDEYQNINKWLQYANNVYVTSSDRITLLND